MTTDPEECWESPSLEWIRRIREAHYQETKDLPLEVWLRVADSRGALAACKELGLKVRLSNATANRAECPKES